MARLVRIYELIVQVLIQAKLQILMVLLSWRLEEAVLCRVHRSSAELSGHLRQIHGSMLGLCLQEAHLLLQRLLDLAAHAADERRLVRALLGARVRPGLLGVVSCGRLQQRIRPATDRATRHHERSSVHGPHERWRATKINWQSKLANLGRRRAQH